MDRLPDELSSAIEARLRDRDVIGLAVCGFDADGIRFAVGAGSADLRRNEPVTRSTIFRVASISKLLTATLVLQLVDSGALDLDAPVNEYLPPKLHLTDPSGGPAASPLRTLLSHTSGLAFGVRGIDLGNPAMSYVSNQGRVRSLAAAISGLRLIRGPGEKVVYSNPAYNVAGYVAARAVDLPFEFAVRERVLRPLGMLDSEFTPHRAGPGVATPYGSVIPPKVGRRPADAMRLVATPMGGLTSSVDDLARFGRMLLNEGAIEGRPILSPEILAEAMSTQASNHAGLDQGYGLGFKVRTWRGRTLIGHDGNMPGVATQLLVSPGDGVGVVVLTNGYALSIPHEIAILTLEHLLGLSRQSVGSESSTAASRADRQAWESLADRAHGTYRMEDASPPGVLGRLNDLRVRVRVTHEGGGRLRVEGNPGANGPMVLHPEGALGRYLVEAPVDAGISAIVEERDGGFDIWSGYTTHFRR